MLDDWTGMNKLKAKEYILTARLTFKSLECKFEIAKAIQLQCLILVATICSHMMEALAWFLVPNLMVSNFI